MSIHPQIVERNGKKEFVILPYEEFVWLQAALEDYEDLKALRAEKAISEQEPSQKLDDVLKETRE